MSSFVLLLLILILLAILPFVPNPRIRYYACYTFYTVYACLVSFCCIPLGIWSPRNPESINIYSKLVSYLSIPLGIEFEIRNGLGLTSKRGQKAILVANHQNIFDSIGMSMVNLQSGTLTPVAARKLLYIFPWGPAAWLCGVLFVDRRRYTKSGLISQAMSVLNHGVKLWFFPEGTRNPETDDLLPFKKGAFHLAIDCHAPIIPVVFSPFHFIDHKKKTFETGKIILSVLEEIPVEGLTKDSLDDLMNGTREKMREEYKKLRNEVLRR